MGLLLYLLKGSWAEAEGIMSWDRRCQELEKNGIKAEKHGIMSWEKKGSCVKKKVKKEWILKGVFAKNEFVWMLRSSV